tara:strand:- start:90 stop:746 length:657 start_codon:yes stop_codon:yes gene_type:complete
MYQVYCFNSEPQRTPLAPKWKYFFAEEQTNNIDIKALTKFLLKKEKDILKLESCDDGYTGLGIESVTSRHLSYNFFKLKNKEINKLKKNIISLHNKFIADCDILLPKNLFIKGWYNILRRGEKIKPHIHDVSPDSYLGGHFCVQCKNTSTYYMNPVDQLNNPNTHESTNVPGKLTLFQNCMPHYTSSNKSNVERITIAFDIRVSRTKGHPKSRWEKLT